MARSPDLAFGVLWKYYFQGKLTRLSIHPVANFVVAKSFERLDEQQLREVYLELSGSWTRIIRKFMPCMQSSNVALPFISEASRPGVLLSLIDRAVSLKALGTEVEEVWMFVFWIFDAGNSLT